MLTNSLDYFGRGGAHSFPLQSSPITSINQADRMAMEGERFSVVNGSGANVDITFLYMEIRSQA
jgi:hypothetical protein